MEKGLFVRAAGERIQPRRPSQPPAGERRGVRGEAGFLISRLPGRG